jgi:SAM-dependent methyltransferase
MQYMSAPERRSTFDQVPELYDRVRPGYPSELFDDLELVAGLTPDSSVLEIGAGTGQATRSLADRGYRVVALELGSGLADVARRRLAAFPKVEVITAAFEDWPLRREPFDLVFAATAWHWLEADVRLAKTARALRPGGFLATVETHHVDGGTQRFFIDAQDCYQRWDPETPPDFKLPTVDDVPFDDQELLTNKDFANPAFRDYETDIEYTGDDYLDVLRTYSGTIAMTPDAAAGLLNCIGTLINDHYDGRITKRYLRRLRISERAPYSDRLDSERSPDG